jgi:hypothetical protein
VASGEGWWGTRRAGRPGGGAGEQCSAALHCAGAHVPAAASPTLLTPCTRRSHPRAETVTSSPEQNGRSGAHPSARAG